MRFVIEHLATIDSTNTEAMRRAAQGAAEGLCLVADEQTRGRGRQERAWFSPPGAGLYLSVLLRPQHLPLASWPLLTLMTAVATFDALALTTRDEVEFDIKWPNDIYANERKLGGILAETVDGGKGVVLGIGINLKDAAFPPEVAQQAVSLQTLLPARAPDKDDLLTKLLAQIEAGYARLETTGETDAILHAWTTRSSYACGKRVRVMLDQKGDDGDVIEGVTRGLEADGALRVETARNKIVTVRAGDVQRLR